MRYLLAILFAVVGHAQAPTTLAIRDARIVPVTGPAMERGTVVIRDGLISAVGVDAAIPPGAWIIDGAGLTVYPGLIDAMSGWGMPNQPAGVGGGRGGGGGGPQPAGAKPEQSNSALDRPATTSWVKAADELQPNDARLERARNAGFTTAIAFPMRGIFGGQGSVINLAGEKARDMVLEASVGQYITMNSSGVGYPASLMGTISYIRQVYLDAEHYTQVKQAYEADPRGMKRPDYDRALEGVLESKRILLPADSLVEIERMLRFAQEVKQPAILYGVEEGYRAANLLRDARAGVLVGLKWPERPRDPDPERVETLRTLQNRDQGPSTPAELVKAGVKFALYSDGIDQARDLQRAVKKAIDAGLSRDDAVRALTLWPAEMFGVADRLGSIEPGKIANLAVTRGDIFDDNTRIEMVFIDGIQHRPAPEAAKPKPEGVKP